MPTTRFKHPFSSTVKSFRTASGKTGRLYSLPALAKTFPNVQRLPVSPSQWRSTLSSTMRSDTGSRLTLGNCCARAGSD